MKPAGATSTLSAEWPSFRSATASGEIYDAVGRHAQDITYAYGGANMTTLWQEKLAEAIISLAPKNMRRVYFVCGGSEANETAVKMARQYHLHRGNASKPGFPRRIPI